MSEPMATEPRHALTAAMLLELFIGEGRIEHRTQPPEERCRELMPTDGTCDCGLREARAIARAALRDEISAAHDHDCNEVAEGLAASARTDL